MPVVSEPVFTAIYPNISPKTKLYIIWSMLPWTEEKRNALMHIAKVLPYFRNSPRIAPLNKSSSSIAGKIATEMKFSRNSAVFCGIGRSYAALSSTRFGEISEPRKDTKNVSIPPNDAIICDNEKAIKK